MRLSHGHNISGTKTSEDLIEYLTFKTCENLHDKHLRLLRYDPVSGYKLTVLIGWRTSFGFFGGLEGGACTHFRWLVKA